MGTKSPDLSPTNERRRNSFTHLIDRHIVSSYLKTNNRRSSSRRESTESQHNKEKAQKTKSLSPLFPRKKREDSKAQENQASLSPLTAARRARSSTTHKPHSGDKRMWRLSMALKPSEEGLLMWVCNKTTNIF